MSFKDQLRKKIEINALAARIMASMGPPDSGRRVDKDLVRQLLAEGGYEKIVERDMELYRLSPSGDKPRLLVLDNDLPIYGTGVEDVVLRKSPVVKEMLNIRNVMKILNDADVVISKKDVSLNTLREELIADWICSSQTKILTIWSMTDAVPWRTAMPMVSRRHCVSWQIFWDTRRHPRRCKCRTIPSGGLWGKVPVGQCLAPSSFTMPCTTP
jgi:hypothetical protein